MSPEVLSKWNQLLVREMSNAHEDELSALSAWVGDCEDSFRDIYSDLLVQIANASPDDYSTILDCLVEINSHLEHIKNHIVSAESGLLDLIVAISKKEESQG